MTSTTDIDPWLVRLVSATALGQVLIVWTGGAVRISGSGLGCPEWPRCTSTSLVPEEPALTAFVEFGNRLLAVILLGLCVASWVAVNQLALGPQLARLTSMQVVLVVAQGLLGGISVIIELHPAVVAAHLLLSAGAIYCSVAATVEVLARRCRWSVAASPEPRSYSYARLSTVALVAGVFVAGTGILLTASGPYGGDPAARRLDADESVLALPHGLAAMTLLVTLLGIGAIVSELGELPAGRALPLVALVLLVTQVGVGMVQVGGARTPYLAWLHLAIASSLLAALATLDVVLKRLDRWRQTPVGAA